MNCARHRYRGHTGLGKYSEGQGQNEEMHRLEISSSLSVVYVLIVLSIKSTFYSKTSDSRFIRYNPRIHANLECMLAFSHQQEVVMIL